MPDNIFNNQYLWPDDEEAGYTRRLHIWGYMLFPENEERRKQYFLDRLRKAYTKAKEEGTIEDIWPSQSVQSAVNLLAIEHIQKTGIKKIEETTRIRKGFIASLALRYLFAAKISSTEKNNYCNMRMWQHHLRECIYPQRQDKRSLQKSLRHDAPESDQRLDEIRKDFGSVAHLWAAHFTPIGEIHPINVDSNPNGFIYRANQIAKSAVDKDIYKKLLPGRKHLNLPCFHTIDFSPEADPVESARPPVFGFDFISLYHDYLAYGKVSPDDNYYQPHNASYEKFSEFTNKELEVLGTYKTEKTIDTEMLNSIKPIQS